MTKTMVALVLGLAANVAWAFGPPPAEAVSACSGKSSGTTCSFTANGSTQTGTCEAGPPGAPVACLSGLRHHHGPPPEALSACSGKSDGAACSVTFGDKTLEGTCSNGPRGDALACRPKDGHGPGMHHHHRGPPPEALTACQGLSSGAGCSVVLGGQARAGTCRQGPPGEPLACVPAPPAEAVSACSGKSDGTSCSMTLGGTAVTGTCRTGPGGGTLACHHRGPPPPPGN